jgi:hypothetical protein
MLEAIGETSGGRVLVEQFRADPKRWAVRLTPIVRELAAIEATIDDVRDAGRRIAGWKNTRPLNWLAQSGELARIVSDTKASRNGAKGGERDAHGRYKTIFSEEPGT